MTMFADDHAACKRKGNANVKVVVRLRPPNEAEHHDRYHIVTHAISDHMLVFDPKVQSGPGVLQAKPRDVNRHRFRDLKYAFDYVFGPCATNRDVFEHTTKSIVTGVLSGYNCSVFAYGATGAGKTHTMLGHNTEPGVIYFTMMDLYRRIEEQKQDKIFDVAVSYSEVYNEQVRDLLIPRENLPIREDKTAGVIIAGLSLHKPKTAEELLHMLQFGNKNRTQHPTDANAESSRSHAVFQVFVNHRDKTENGSREVVMAKMCLVDLAGSERAHASTNCGARFREGANINRSLLALGNVINALADNRFKGHIPYRDSKLTRLLKDSLGGNCRTVMIAAVSPSSRSFEDTYNTLRYADRAKHIRTDIKKNVMNVEFHIANYKKYVQELEKQNQELRKTKKDLLESIKKAETGGSSGHIISPIMRQFQERLKDLFKVRRDIRKVQMESEGAKRELKWKVSRREQAIKRVKQLTGSLNVLSKHGRVIERMKKLIDKKEHALQDSAHRIQGQDSAICQAIAEFTATDGRQVPEFLDLNARTYIAESNLYDSDMYLTYVKKLARAQERQADASESLVQCLLQLVKKQHDVLHSQDLLSPELQHIYDQCCCLVEERGVAFSQHASSQRGAGGDVPCGDGGLSPSGKTAAAESEGEDCLSVSDVIDIHIPRLRVQGLIQSIAQAKPQSQPQRVLKPVSAVRPAARITSTQFQEAASMDNPAVTATQHHQLPGHPGLVSQGTFSKAPSSQHAPLYPAVQTGCAAPTTATVNPIEMLNRSQESCHRQGATSASNNHVGLSQNPAAINPHNAGLCTLPGTITGSQCDEGPKRVVAPLTNSTHHHQFPICAATNHAPTVFPTTKQSMWPSSSPPQLSPQSLKWTIPLSLNKAPSKPPQTHQPSCSPEANSSTDNVNNTFVVLQPALPNTPCIDTAGSGTVSKPHHQQHVSQNKDVPPCASGPAATSHLSSNAHANDGKNCTATVATVDHFTDSGTPKNGKNNTTAATVDQFANVGTPKNGKKSPSNFSTRALSFQSAVMAASKDNHHHHHHPASKALMGEGDGVQTRLHPHHHHTAGLDSSANANLSFTQGKLAHNRSKSFNLASMATSTGVPGHPGYAVMTPPYSKRSQQSSSPSPGFHQSGSSPSAHSPVRRPGALGSAGRKQHVNTNNANSHCDLSSSPKSYAEALKSPVACQVFTGAPKTPVRVKVSSTSAAKTPVRVNVSTSSAKTPLRVQVSSSCAKDTDQQKVTMVTPSFDLSHLKQQLRLTCEKLPVPARVETAKQIDHFTGMAARKPLGSLDPNTKQKPVCSFDFKSSSNNPSTLVNTNISTKDLVQSATIVPTTTSVAPPPLQLKAQPSRVRDRRHHRALAASNPYSSRNPRRQPRWQPAGILTSGNVDSLGAVQCNRPSYMQPTFARAQKMMGLDPAQRQPQRQIANAGLPRRVTLPKQRFVLT